MKKNVSLFVVLGVTAALLAGCGGAKSGDVTEGHDASPGVVDVGKSSGDDAGSTMSDGHEEMTYMSSDGFQVRYNAMSVEAMEIDEHSVQFVYTGESAGTNMVIISCIPDKQPEEALYELTSAWGEQESVSRREGFFPGTDDKWGYWRELFPEDGVSSLAETAIAGEYNGGVLMFEIVSHMSGNDETDMAVSDTMSGIIDSITYDSFEPQTMYSYYPGTYVADNEKLVLNDDHSGVLSIQDDIDIIWGSNYVTASDGSFTYEFSIEGDNLNLNYDGEWLEFNKAK